MAHPLQNTIRQIDLLAAGSCLLLPSFLPYLLASTTSPFTSTLVSSMVLPCLGVMLPLVLYRVLVEDHVQRRMVKRVLEDAASENKKMSSSIDHHQPLTLHDHSSEKEQTLLLILSPSSPQPQPCPPLFSITTPILNPRSWILVGLLTWTTLMGLAPLTRLNNQFSSDLTSSATTPSGTTTLASSSSSTSSSSSSSSSPSPWAIKNPWTIWDASKLSSTHSRGASSGSDGPSIMQYWAEDPKEKVGGEEWAERVILGRRQQPYYSRSQQHPLILPLPDPIPVADPVIVTATLALGNEDSEEEGWAVLAKVRAAEEDIVLETDVDEEEDGHDDADDDDKVDREEEEAPEMGKPQETCFDKDPHMPRTDPLDASLRLDKKVIEPLDGIGCGMGVKDEMTHKTASTRADMSEERSVNALVDYLEALETQREPQPYPPSPCSSSLSSLEKLESEPCPPLSPQSRPHPRRVFSHVPFWTESMLLALGICLGSIWVGLEQARKTILQDLQRLSSYDHRIDLGDENDPHDIEQYQQQYGAMDAASHSSHPCPQWTRIQTFYGSTSESLATLLGCFTLLLIPLTLILWMYLTRQWDVPSLRFMPLGVAGLGLVLLWVPSNLAAVIPPSLSTLLLCFDTMDPFE